MKWFLFFFLVFTLLNMHLGTTNSYLQTFQSFENPDINTNDITSNRIQRSDIPGFSLEDINLTGGPGTYNFTAIIQHSGIAATPGIVPIIWEKNTTTIELDDGRGTLDESILDLDLDGDGDKEDTFNIEWFHNSTRSYDATINGDHVYAIIDSVEENLRVMTYSIAGKSKSFTLGNNKHALYYCDQIEASFGFYNPGPIMHPSPSLDLCIVNWNVSTKDSLVVSNFQINGEVVQLNYSNVIIGRLYFDLPISALSSHITPSNPLSINIGDLIAFSCTIKAYESTSVEIFIHVNWSPDGIVRYRYQWWFESLAGVKLEPGKINSTTDTTTTTSTEKIAGFSFTICLFAILPIVFLYLKEHNRRFN